MTNAEFKSALASLGLSQTAFAALFDVSQKTVSFWANGTDGATVPRPIALYIELRMTIAGLTEDMKKAAG